MEGGQAAPGRQRLHQPQCGRGVGVLAELEKTAQISFQVRRQVIPARSAWHLQALR